MRFDAEALAHGVHLDDKMRNAKLLRKFASARASVSLVCVCVCVREREREREREGESE